MPMNAPVNATTAPSLTTRTGRLLSPLKEHPLARLGPGLITGVADDDPSGIATYSQAGAQFGLNMLWTMPVAFPLMAAIQLMCARIGRVTGKGLAANIKDAFSPAVLRIVVLLLLTANILNIAADIAAMGEVAELVSGLSRHLVTPLFAFTHARPTNPCPVPSLRLVFEVAHLFTACLCRSAFYSPRPVERSRAAHLLAAPQSRC